MNNRQTKSQFTIDSLCVYILEKGRIALGYGTIDVKRYSPLEKLTIFLSIFQESKIKMRNFVMCTDHWNSFDEIKPTLYIFLQFIHFLISINVNARVKCTDI